MLLELLSDFQISIPELGRIEASTMPLVLLTSNNSRELTEALKRRCLYLWIDYPSLEHELEIVRLHAPELDEKISRRLVEVVAMVRRITSYNVCYTKLLRWNYRKQLLRIQAEAQDTGWTEVQDDIFGEA